MQVAEGWTFHPHIWLSLACPITPKYEVIKKVSGNDWRNCNIERTTSFGQDPCREKFGRKNSPFC
jgi:hypothetical protein